MNQLDFKGRHAVVTGGATGLGFAIAQRLIASGGTVTLWDRDARSAGDAASRLGKGATAVTVEVTSHEQIQRAVEATLKHSPRIDALVNSAGITGPNTKVWEYPVDEWRQVMDVNVASMFLMCRAVVPELRKRGGGRIVNISSGTPFRGVPFLLHYVTSKGAIVAFTRALAKELGKDNVLVNCVAPGFTMSAGVEAHPEVIEKLRDVSVAARTIQRDQVPEDVVGAVVFLCTSAADFVTGQTMVIDGGQYFH